MTDQPATAAISRPQEIRLDCLDEVREWMKMFECREEELMLAVRAVGTSPEAVRRHLQRGPT